jgi:hypothetical protein
MRRSIVLVMFVAALLIASCSSCAESGQQNGRDGDAEKAATVPTTTETPTATIEQFASIVAEHKGDWDEVADRTKANCLDPATVPACVLGYMTLGIKADTIHLVLTGAHEAGNPTYIGEPPAEIEDLLTATETAASKVNPAVGAFRKAGCTDPMEPACLSQYMAMDSAVDELSRKLDAWTAY